MTEPETTANSNVPWVLIAIVVAVLAIGAAVFVVTRPAETDGAVDSGLPSRNDTLPPLTNVGCLDPVGDVDFDPKTKPPGLDVNGIDIEKMDVQFAGETVDVTIDLAAAPDPASSPTYVIVHGEPSTPQSFELRVEPSSSAAGAPWRVALVTFKNGQEKRDPPMDGSGNRPNVPVTVTGDTITFSVPKKDLPSVAAQLWIFGATAGNVNEAPSDDCNSTQTQPVAPGSTVPGVTTAPPTTIPTEPLGATQAYRTGTLITPYAVQSPPEPGVVTAAPPADRRIVVVDAKICASERGNQVSSKFFELKDADDRQYTIWETVNPDEIQNLFPTTRVLAPQECLRANIPYPIPIDSEIVSLHYSPDLSGQGALSWSAR